MLARGVHKFKKIINKNKKHVGFYKIAREKG